jgi:hypothetical protein
MGPLQAINFLTSPLVPDEPHARLITDSPLALRDSS